MTRPPAKLTIEEVLEDLALRDLAPRLVIWLDGVKQDAVTAYDTAEGTVERYVKDEAGQLVTEGGHAKREVVHGEVKVELRDG